MLLTTMIFVILTFVWMVFVTAHIAVAIDKIAANTSMPVVGPATYVKKFD